MDIENLRLSAADFHQHLKARMLQRGVTIEEVERTLMHGWQAKDAKTGTEGRTFVFEYLREWEGKDFAEEEVTVYYKSVGSKLVLLTVKARYGKKFLRGGDQGANRI